MKGSKYKDEERDCFAKPSASTFIDLEKKLKVIPTKAEEMVLISLMVLIARMSVELSEKHLSFLNPRVSAESRADRRAKASAMRGELI